MKLDDTGNDRRLIRRGDPASSLPHLRDDQLVRLMENTMSRTQTTKTPASPARSRRAWLFGGGAGIAAIGAAAIAIPLAVGPAMSATSLDQVPTGGPAAMCAEVTPAAVQDADTAFRATVTTIEGKTVTLTVDDRYQGDVNATVTVPQGDGAGIDGEPIVFTPDTTYLIATRDGIVISCGISGEATPDLESVYTTAFG